jgi:hypothetical protein
MEWCDENREGREFAGGADFRLYIGATRRRALDENWSGVDFP